jgi:hypothetical protein
MTTDTDTFMKYRLEVRPWRTDRPPGPWQQFATTHNKVEAETMFGLLRKNKDYAAVRLSKVEYTTVYEFPNPSKEA